MKTTELYTELVNQGVTAELVSCFAYSYDADRRYREIHILKRTIDETTAALISNSGHEAIETRVVKTDGNVYDIVAVRPIKGSDNVEWTND